MGTLRAVVLVDIIKDLRPIICHLFSQDSKKFSSLKATKEPSLSIRLKTSVAQPINFGVSANGVQFFLGLFFNRSVNFV